jgi:hypothetical protein
VIDSLRALSYPRIALAPMEPLSVSGENIDWLRGEAFEKMEVSDEGPRNNDA